MFSMNFSFMADETSIAAEARKVGTASFATTIRLLVPIKVLAESNVSDHEHEKKR